MLNLDADARAIFNLNDIGVTCLFQGNSGPAYTATVHYSAQNRDASLPGVGVSSTEESIEFATSTLPGIAEGNVIELDLSQYEPAGEHTSFKVRNVNPQDDGVTSIAVLKRMQKR